ncbi:MAG: nucleotidyltransferase family protein [Candidatus Omnitrophota bacterium]
MKVLILAGGYGTRLYPLITDTAKALLKVKNKPIIDYLLDKIADLPELDEVIVVTNDKFYQDFCVWAKQHTNLPCRIDIINDQTKTNEDRLGSIGDIRYVLKEKKIRDHLMVVGGDNIFDFNIDVYVEFAKMNVPRVTVGLFDIQNIKEAHKFGVVELNQDKKVISFEEKPKRPKSSLIAMCLYYFPQESLDLIERYLKESKKSDAAGGYIQWLRTQEDVYGFVFDGKWYDIGSIEAYHEAQDNL